jgi:zinc and cadmium transporter
LWLPGLAVFLVTILHKPLDALTVLTLARSAGHRPWTSHLINAGFALMVPAGVAMFLLGFGVADAGGAVVAYALAFSAGTFLCISLSDLLPELQFHAHDRFKLTAALAVGLLAAGTIAYVEGSTDAHDHHGHGHGQEQPVPLEQRLPGLDGHDGHDHEGHGHPH